jgi:hypothetical protein
MIRVEELISQLLLRHSCVIVPGFGGFVAKRVSAVVDLEMGVMLPPKKALLFNKQLINNDGLLINELAARSTVSYNEAAALIGSMVQTWNNELSKGARVQIDKVGFLFYDQEKNLCFEQDRFFNLLLESFGLSKVHFVFEEQKEETKIIELNTQSTQEFEIRTLQYRKQAVWKYVAAACFLPVAFYSFWIPSKTNVMESGMFSTRDFNPFFKHKTARYSPEKLDQIQFDSISVSSPLASDSYQFLPGLIFPVQRDAGTVPDPQACWNNANGIVATHQYIVGCFQSRINVDLMLSKLRSAGLDAYVFDISNGLQRVSAGGADNQYALGDIRQKVAALGIQGWVYRSN